MRSQAWVEATYHSSGIINRIKKRTSKQWVLSLLHIQVSNAWRWNSGSTTFSQYLCFSIFNDGLPQRSSFVLFINALSRLLISQYHWFLEQAQPDPSSFCQQPRPKNLLGFLYTDGLVKYKKLTYPGDKVVPSENILNQKQLTDLHFTAMCKTCQTVGLLQGNKNRCYVSPPIHPMIFYFALVNLLF